MNGWPRFGTANALPIFKVHVSIRFQNLSSKLFKAATPVLIVFNCFVSDLYLISHIFSYDRPIISCRFQAVDAPKIFVPELMSQNDFIANDDGNATWRRYFRAESLAN